MFRPSSGIDYEKIIEGWERSETASGVPYYVNHSSSKTQWDHPWIVKLQEELDEMDDVKYAAYRTALKLRFLQKKFCIDLLDLRTINVIFDRHGFRGGNDRFLDCSKAYSMLLDLCNANRVTGAPGGVSSDMVSELLLNWLLNLFDMDRNGRLRVISMKIALGTLCAARLSEKYRFFFRELCDSSNHISRKQMAIFLHDIMQIPIYLGEAAPFGGTNVAPAINSCFATAWNTGGITEDEFTSWLLREPQTVVWLPTMHRLSAAETVKHEAKCSTCKAFPIIGFRYRCLKCFNYDLCQLCFFTGRTSKRHKIKHPTQEYCIATTAKQDTKDFMKTVRNNLSKKHCNKKKLRYLPIRASQRDYADDSFPTATQDPGHNEQSIPGHDPAGYEDSEEEEGADPDTEREDQADTGTDSDPDNQPVLPVHTKHLATTVVVSGDPDDDYVRIVKQLELENRDLLHELERLRTGAAPYPMPAAYPAPVSPQHPQTPSTRSGSEASEIDWLREEREKLEAKQEVLESHNKQLELQLYKLRMLLKQEGVMGQATSTPIFAIPTPPPNQQGPPPYQATPTTGKHSLAQSLLLRRLAPHVLADKSKLSSRSNGSPADATDDMGTLDSKLNLDDTALGQTYFSLPSPNQSQYFPEEEAELQEIMEKLNKVYPAEMTRSLLSTSHDTLGELFSAANKIGDAFSGFVGSMPVKDAKGLDVDTTGMDGTNVVEHEVDSLVHDGHPDDPSSTMQYSITTDSAVYAL